jgi:bifunctional non-homologous end joining protein LigD
MSPKPNSLAPIMPSIEPMLCTLVRTPFDDPHFLFEVKWDGYRLIAYKSNGVVTLKSRGGHDYTKKYPPIVKALAAIDIDFIFDGEAVVLNKEGKPDFDALQNFNGQRSGVVYFVFDILWLNGKSLLNLPLEERKTLLSTVVKSDKIIKYSDHFDSGIQLFSEVTKHGLEGIIAKRRDSQYVPGKRGRDWLKIPTEIRQEFVIGGWIDSEKRNTFRTLLFGTYESGRLKWKGHAGGGFKEKQMAEILKRLQAIEVPTNPFDTDVDYSEGKPHWVQPILVANIKYAATTSSGKIRKPAIFLGFREDKSAEQVTTERPIPISQVTTLHAPHSDSTTLKRKLPTTDDSNWPAVESVPINSKDVFRIDECDLTLTNVEKKLWKGVLKADLIEYYNRISKYIMPHIQQRPLSLHIKLKGPNAPGLYIKDMEGRQPDFADVFQTERKHRKPGKRDRIDYLVCNNTPTLLYTINLGCIDVNPWTSTILDPTHPNFIVIDLDPTDEDFNKTIESARAVKHFLDEHSLVGLAKTSGKTGIHIFVPCVGVAFPQARTLAAFICEEVHRLVPSITTTSTTVADRGTKLYLDPSQNDYTDTVASPYSVRPFKLPLVSAPIDWDELNATLDPGDFNIRSMISRVDKRGDLFNEAKDPRTAKKNTIILKMFL